MLESENVLLERAAAAVELAAAEGADGSWAKATSMRSTSCRVRDGELEKMQQSNSRRLSMSLYVDGRFFTHSTSDLRDEPLRQFVREAVALTRAIEPDPFRELPDPALFEGRTQADLQTVDAGLLDLTPQARIDRCKELDALVAGGDKVISAMASLSDGRYTMGAASSNGFSGAYTSSWIGQYANLTLQGEGDRRPEGGMGATARHAADLPDLRWIGDEAKRRAFARLGSTKGPTTTTTLVVDRLSVPRLLYALIGPASGRALQQGQSFWADKLGKRVVSKALSVTDDPHIPRAIGSRPFDGEGIASRPMSVLTDGALKNYFIDTYYGRKLEMPPTTSSSSNLVVAPGRGDLKQLLADVGSGVYVTSWLGGNSDGTTGEFSLGLRGHRIEKGTVGAPIGEMNVTGNLLEFWSKLSVVGDDVWTYGGARTPTMVFEDVSFSGA
ncbi:MAG: TldD/PmbA family protein [Myxococcota bacterium]